MGVPPPAVRRVIVEANGPRRRQSVLNNDVHVDAFSAFILVFLGEVLRCICYVVRDSTPRIIVGRRLRWGAPHPLVNSLRDHPSEVPRQAMVVKAPLGSYRNFTAAPSSAQSLYTTNTLLGRRPLVEKLATPATLMWGREVPWENLNGQ